MSASRHHHYLSQCYLKGFTQGNSKNSKLTVLDLKNNKKFETIPRNVGGMRDFNRVEIEGIDPEIIEKTQAEFEGMVATALKRLESTLDFSGNTKNLILELVGMLAIKSPEMRRHLAEPQIEIAKQMMAMQFESKERWEAQAVKADTNSGKEPSKNISYEVMKEFFERQEYKITITPEHQIHMELLGMQHITQLLHYRGWVLLRAEEDAGEFITTDNPVCLSWNTPSNASSFASPGFGMADTMVYFPISKSLALVGEFDRENETKKINKQLVAIFNSKIIANCYQRVISSKSNFNYIAKGGELKQGSSLV